MAFDYQSSFWAPHSWPLIFSILDGLLISLISWYAGVGAVFQHRYESWLLWNMMKHLSYLQISWFMMHVIMFHYTSCAFLWAIQSDDQCLLCVYRVFTVCLPCVQGIPKQAKSWSSSAAWKASSRACDAMSIVELNGAHSGTYPHHFAEPHKSWFKHIFPQDYSLVSPSIWGWVKTLSPWWTSK